MLVTTVAALGWVATKGVVFWSPCIKLICVGSLALSVIFAVFTLALVPLVEEQRRPYESIYLVKAKWSWGPPKGLRLRCVCLPQHIFFIVGVLAYAIGTIR